MYSTLFPGDQRRQLPSLAATRAPKDALSFLSDGAMDSSTAHCETTTHDDMDLRSNSLFVWTWLVVNDRKFSAGAVFFSHTNQPAVLLHESATI